MGHKIQNIGDIMKDKDIDWKEVAKVFAHELIKMQVVPSFWVTGVIENHMKNGKGKERYLQRKEDSKQTASSMLVGGE